MTDLQRTPSLGIEGCLREAYTHVQDVSRQERITVKRDDRSGMRRAVEGLVGVLGEDGGCHRGEDGRGGASCRRRSRGRLADGVETFAKACQQKMPI